MREDGAGMVRTTVVAMAIMFGVGVSSACRPKGVASTDEGGSTTSNTATASTATASTPHVVVLRVPPEPPPGGAASASEAPALAAVLKTYPAYEGLWDAKNRAN